MEKYKRDYYIYAIRKRNKLQQHKVNTKVKNNESISSFLVELPDYIPKSKYLASIMKGDK